MIPIRPSGAVAVGCAWRHLSFLPFVCITAFLFVLLVSGPSWKHSAQASGHILLSLSWMGAVLPQEPGSFRGTDRTPGLGHGGPSRAASFRPSGLGPTLHTCARTYVNLCSSVAVNATRWDPDYPVTTWARPASYPAPTCRRSLNCSTAG